jgi:hypothetical protein
MDLAAGGNSELKTELRLIETDRQTRALWQTQDGSDSLFQERAAAESGIAWQAWQALRNRNIDDRQAVYSLEVMLTRPDTREPLPLQAALAVVTVGSNKVEWDRQDFFVLPSLWGTGIGGSFLRAIVKDLPKRRAVAANSVCQVKLPTINPTDPASRNDLIGVIDFYKAAGFRTVSRDGMEKFLERKL